MGTTNAQTDSERANDEAYINGSTIEAFYAESVILVTGATGFLGKALVEKLLRSCPRLATIFVLMRPKRGQTVEQRFNALLENSIFDRIRSKFPGAFNKVRPVKGDVTMPNLGLSSDDWNMLAQRVNIVFHSAATVRFNEPLRVAVNLNTQGTDRVIELCKSMKNLISVIHVSTAYSNANRQEIQELVYTTQVKPSTVINMCESLDDETLKIIEKKLLENHPNTYTFTKNLAEQIILTKANDLPVAIVRPSIICAALKEPYPGWVDNVCGVTGIMTEIGRGTIRSIVCNKNLEVDIVPVDYVVDTIICASWHSTIQHSNTVRIYNCTNNASRVSWGEFGRLVRQHAIESPSKYVMWYPGCTFRTNRFIHNVIAATLHFLPAFVVDFLLKLQGGKPIMMKTTKRVGMMTKTGEFFTTHEWQFHRDNMHDMAKKLAALKDGEQFNTDMKNLNWESYSRQYVLGIRKFILKDNLDSLKNARNRLSKLYWIHKLTQIISIFILLVMITRAGR